MAAIVNLKPNVGLEPSANLEPGVALEQSAVLDAEGGGTKSSLDSLFRLVEGDLGRVNSAIIDHMQSPVQLIPQLAGHLIAAGGKRVRPMITLGTAALCSYQGDRHIKLAACVEFIHTATLLHDDVVDRSGLRRGQDSANAVWGNQASVLVGDFLFSRAFQLMVADGSLAVLKILSDASTVIAEGEVRQLTIANNAETEEGDYLDVIRSKTAALFAAAARIGAVVAGRPAADETALESFGVNLGLAFQLIDDALDYTADQGDLGKTVGDDFREGKVTLPVILAFRRGDAEEQAFWRRTLEAGDQRGDDLARAQALIHRRGGLRDTLALARHHASLAHDALAPFPDGDARRSLADAVDFCVERAY